MRAIVVTLMCASFCASCQSYYVVTDLRNNERYYTRDNLWMMQRRHGGLQFQDLYSGDVISLDCARAHKLNTEEIQELKNSHQPLASKP
jgi:hypothetical protein